jgi:hypothetical protein
MKMKTQKEFRQAGWTKVTVHAYEGIDIFRANNPDVKVLVVNQDYNPQAYCVAKTGDAGYFGNVPVYAGAHIDRITCMVPPGTELVKELTMAEKFSEKFGACHWGTEESINIAIAAGATAEWMDYGTCGNRDCRGHQQAELTWPDGSHRLVTVEDCD